MESKFTIGDLVCLKSGGPTMTVNGVTTYDWENKPTTFDGKVSATWFDANNQLTGATFHEDTLELDSDED